MQETIQAIQAIHKTQRRIATVSGITMGLLMCIYFFTFATLIDRGLFGALLFEIITSIAFIFAFIFMNPLSYYFTRLIHGRRHKALFLQLSAGDINKTAEQVYQAINGDRPVETP
jgi:hypothetical protein